MCMSEIPNISENGVYNPRQPLVRICIHRPHSASTCNFALGRLKTKEGLFYLKIRAPAVLLMGIYVLSISLNLYL